MSRRAFRVCAVLTLLSAWVSAGFSLAALLAAPTNSVAQYAASRSFALAVGTLVVVARSWEQALIALALVMSAVQAMDGVIGLLAHDASKTWGPFAFAVFTALAGASLLRRSPLPGSRA